MFNDNRKKQVDLIEAFWSSVPGYDAKGPRMLGLVSDIKQKKARNLQPIYKDNERFVVLKTIGDISEPNDKNICLKNLIASADDKCLDPYTSMVLMTYYERKTGSESGDQTYRTGPCQYNYPDGSIAAYELYSDSSDPLGAGVLKNAVYFDKTGKQTSQQEFDIIYRQELEKVWMHHPVPLAYEYAPRIQEHNGLVNDLYIEITSGGGRIDPVELREIVLSEKSDTYLDMLASDVMKVHRSMPFPEEICSDEFLNKEIRLFVYGEIKGLEEYDAEKIIQDSYRKFGIDAACVRKEGPYGGQTVTYIGNPDKVMHYISKDSSGQKTDEGFVVNYRGHLCRHGHAFEYYPEGTLSKVQQFDFNPRFAGEDFGSLQLTDVNIDMKGRITSWSIASKQSDKAWKDFRTKKAENRNVTNNKHLIRRK